MTVTGKKLNEHLEKYGHTVTDDHDREYWVISWVELNKIHRSGTAHVVFSGNVMTDGNDVYRTFSVHPVGEYFEPYAVAIEA